MDGWTLEQVLNSANLIKKKNSWPDLVIRATTSLKIF